MITTAATTNASGLQALRVGLLGIGTVGSGVFNVLARNQVEIVRRAGRGIETVSYTHLDVYKRQDFRQRGPLATIALGTFHMFVSLSN